METEQRQQGEGGGDERREQTRDDMVGGVEEDRVKNEEGESEREEEKDAAEHSSQAAAAEEMKLAHPLVSTLALYLFKNVSYCTISPTPTLSLSLFVSFLHDCTISRLPGHLASTPMYQCTTSLMEAGR